MVAINLQQILDTTNLKPADVAEVLFPLHRYPLQALNRILNGDSLLDSDQIVKLSSITGIPIEDLFNGNWKAKHSKSQYVFTNGSIKAIVDKELSVVRIFDAESMFFETAIIATAISLNDFMVFINTQVNNHLNKQQNVKDHN